MPNSYTNLRIHVIFSTKDRRPLIRDDFRTRLYEYIGGIIRNAHGVLLAAGGTADHVHLLIGHHPQSSVSDLMRLVKANSSKWVHETFAGTPAPGFGATPAPGLAGTTAPGSVGTTAPGFAGATPSLPSIAAAFAWQDGYAAFSVSQSNVQAVKKYIAGQEEHHRTKSFQEELIEFLKRHEVAYDARYISM